MSKTHESKNRILKEQIVEDIKAKLDGAQSVVICGRRPPARKVYVFLWICPARTARISGCDSMYRTVSRVVSSARCCS